MNLKNKLAAGLVLVMAYAIPCCAYAADPGNGMRGPTTTQVDVRENQGTGKKNESSQTLILKYWDGRESGNWAFLSIPYNSGFSKINIGGGPRGTEHLQIGDFHWLSYAALGIPTNSHDKLDAKFGGLFTQKFPNSNFQIDANIEAKVAPYFNLSGGIMPSVALGDSNRIGIGYEYDQKSGDSIRGAFQFKTGKSSHAVLIISEGINGKTNGTTNYTLIFRQNL